RLRPRENPRRSRDTAALVFLRVFGPRGIRFATLTTRTLRRQETPRTSPRRASLRGQPVEGEAHKADLLVRALLAALEQASRIVGAEIDQAGIGAGTSMKGPANRPCLALISANPHREVHPRGCGGIGEQQQAIAAGA